jgi:hypothetical protein
MKLQEGSEYEDLALMLGRDQEVHSESIGAIRDEVRGSQAAKHSNQDVYLNHVVDTVGVHHVPTRAFRIDLKSQPPLPRLESCSDLTPHPSLLAAQAKVRKEMPPTLRNSTQEKTATSAKAAKDAGYVRPSQLPRPPRSRRQYYTKTKGLVSWKPLKELDAM